MYKWLYKSHIIFIFFILKSNFVPQSRNTNFVWYMIFNKIYSLYAISYILYFWLAVLYVGTYMRKKMYSIFKTESQKWHRCCSANKKMKTVKPTYLPPTTKFEYVSSTVCVRNLNFELKSNDGRRIYRS